MVLADFSLADLIWSLFVIFGLVIFFWLLITIFSDLFRSADLSGWAKAGWVIFVIVLPLLGILVYLIARGGGMADRALKAQEKAQEQFAAYAAQMASQPRGAGSGGDSGASVADEINKLAHLRDKGEISAEEFASTKAKLLS